MSEDRSEQSRYLSASEARDVNEFAQDYIENPPEWHDPIMDPLDLSILKSEGIPTLETSTILAQVRRAEAERTLQRGAAIPERVREACAADDAMADLDDSLWQSVRDSAPLSEDGGWSHLDSVVEEIKAGHKARQRDEARAAKERAATSRRFMGTGFSQERSVTAEQFYRGKGKR